MYYNRDPSGGSPNLPEASSAHTSPKSNTPRKLRLPERDHELKGIEDLFVERRASLGRAAQSGVFRAFWRVFEEPSRSRGFRVLMLHCL